MKKNIIFLMIFMTMCFSGCIDKDPKETHSLETTQSLTEEIKETVEETCSNPISEITESETAVDEDLIVETTVPEEEDVPETTMDETILEPTQQEEPAPPKATEQTSDSSTFEGTAIEGEIGL